MRINGEKCGHRMSGTLDTREDSGIIIELVMGRVLLLELFEVGSLKSLWWMRQVIRDCQVTLEQVPSNS